MGIKKIRALCANSIGETERRNYSEETIVVLWKKLKGVPESLWKSGGNGDSLKRIW